MASLREQRTPRIHFHSFIHFFHFFDFHLKQTLRASNEFFLVADSTNRISFFLRFISIVSPFYLCVYAYVMRAYVEKKNILMERSQKQPYFHTCFNKIRCEKTPTVRIMNCWNWCKGFINTPIYDMKNENLLFDLAGFPISSTIFFHAFLG